LRLNSSAPSICHKEYNKHSEEELDLLNTIAILTKGVVMNTLEAIEQRRSIRKFKDTPVSDEQLQTILQAAVQAPSGKNRQPWRFVVVKSEEKRA
jgi:hypothetical protein